MKKKLVKMVIGMFLPIMMSTAVMTMLAGIIALLTPATFQNCTTTAVFWVIWLLVTLFSYVYVSSEILD